METLSLELQKEAECHTSRVKELLERAAERIDELEELLVLKEIIKSQVNGTLQR